MSESDPIGRLELEYRTILPIEYVRTVPENFELEKYTEGTLAGVAFVQLPNGEPLKKEYKEYKRLEHCLDIGYIWSAHNQRYHSGKWGDKTGVDFRYLIAETRSNDWVKYIQISDFQRGKREFKRILKHLGFATTDGDLRVRLFAYA